MILARLLLAALLAIGLAACNPAARGPGAAALPTESRAQVTVLVSMDAFRSDYLDRGITPRLSALAADGVRATMRPVFPSKTFPNHWSLATGDRPDRHGIVGNLMEDAARPGERFDKPTDDPFWWSATTPVWTEAERAGIRTATMVWPGSNVAIGGRRVQASPEVIEGGTRPSDFAVYSKTLTDPARVDRVIEWLSRPEATRPRFIALYLEGVDGAGHHYGPDDPRTDEAIRTMDALIGGLTDGIAAAGLRANLVVVSDHGMATVARARSVTLDQIASPADFRVLETGTYASIFPVPGHERALEKALLRPHPHLRCWRKSAIPARFHYGRNPRIPPYFCLADVGWQVFATMPVKDGDLGNHGYDNRAPEMAATFIANGPAFRRGVRLKPFELIAVAPLIRDLIGLPARPADGSDAPIRRALIR